MKLEKIKHEITLLNQAELFQLMRFILDKLEQDIAPLSKRNATK